MVQEQDALVVVDECFGKGLLKEGGFGVLMITDKFPTHALWHGANQTVHFAYALRCEY